MFAVCNQKKKIETAQNTPILFALNLVLDKSQAGI